MNTLLTLLGFLFLSLSPSFVDYQEAPQYRGQIVLYYVVALALVYFGLSGWIKDRG